MYARKMLTFRGLENLIDGEIDRIVFLKMLLFRFEQNSVSDGEDIMSFGRKYAS